MKVIGLTGGIASGKSVVSQMIADLGYYVVDTDIIARELLASNNFVIEKVKHYFPEAINEDLNLIDRSKLGQIIFNDSQRRQQLNNIIHPQVKQIVLNEIKAFQGELIFIDVPLLYEASFQDLCDYVIVVYVTLEVQIERLINRDQITRQYAQQKISSQMDLEEKKKLADFVINNNGSLDETHHQLLDLIEKIKGKEIL